MCEIFPPVLLDWFAALRNPRSQHFAGCNMVGCSFGTYPEQEYFAHSPPIFDKMLHGRRTGQSMLGSLRFGCAGLAVIDSVCHFFGLKTLGSTVRGRWSWGRWFMRRQREFATWGFVGDASRNRFKWSRKPLFRVPDLPRIVHLGVFTPIFRQHDSRKARRQGASATPAQNM